MGCGKSKHDVASGNTVRKSSVSRKQGQENGIENKDINNNNVGNVSSRVQVEQKESVSVKEFDVEVKDDQAVNVVKGEAKKINVQEEKEVNVQEGKKDEKTNVVQEKEAEKTNVQEEKEAEKTNVQEEKEAEKINLQEEKKAEPEGGEGKIQETLVAEKQSESEKSEGGKDDSLKENEHKNNDAETIDATEEKMPAENEEEDVSVKKEEDIKDTNTSISEISEVEEKDLKAKEE